MIMKDGEARLKQYAKRSYPKQVYQINDRIRCYVGYGHSNCIVIEGDTSLILIDALDSDERAAKLREELAATSDKPVRTIIFTHGHPDHRGGSAAFADTVNEVIAFAPKRPVLKYMDKLSDMLNVRTVRQFGHHLTEEELITQGLGIREGMTCGEGRYHFLKPTTVYTEDEVERIIDGVPVKLVSAVGETDDQIFIWLPEDEVLCCGDNYYACWPNLYAIRGSQYRDIAAWVDSLGVILSYPAKVLLPGHTNPLFGHETITEVLGNYKGAIEYVLLKTLDCMNRGLSESETVEEVKLPPEYLDKPYLGEHYGTVEWSVRAIYTGYTGWFDGNPTNLYRASDKTYAKHLTAMIGAEKMLCQAQKALADGEYQLALQDADLLLLAGELREEAMAVKLAGLIKLAGMTTSANARHYYLEWVKEQEKK